MKSVLLLLLLGLASTIVATYHECTSQHYLPSHPTLASQENSYSPKRLFARNLKFVGQVESNIFPVPPIKSAVPPNGYTIDVNWHVIHNKEEGKIAESEVREILQAVTSLYRSNNAAFTFALKELDYYDNNKWYTITKTILPEFNLFRIFTNPWDPIGEVEREMKLATRKGDMKVLNIWSAMSATSAYKLLWFQGKTFNTSWGTFPTNTEPAMDGVVVSLKHIRSENKTMGPLAHEIGHWLGLYHPFTNGCNPVSPGDGIDDTPAADSAPRFSQHLNCEKPIDSCPGLPGQDDLQNIMDYVLPKCMTKFTPQQVDRLIRVYQHFRM